MNEVDEKIHDLFDEIEKVSVDITDRTLVAWGTGANAALYNEGLNRIRKRVVISYYADSNSEKWGSVFNGSQIIDPEKIRCLNKPLVVITALSNKSVTGIKHKCISMGIDTITIGGLIAGIYIDDIKRNLSLFYDDKSSLIYSEMLLCSIMCRYPDPHIITSRSLYNIPEFMGADTDGNYIDCGAYTGDTIESYICDRASAYAVNGTITAFEPDEKNFKALLQRMSRIKSEWAIDDDRIRLYNAGVGDRTTTSHFEHSDLNSGGSIITNNDSEKASEVKIYAIDDIIKTPYSFLKADIESFEYKMLIGARETIAKYKPNLSICIYHSVIDMIQLPQLIYEIYPSYRMIVRQHSMGNSETVLYAWNGYN